MPPKKWSRQEEEKRLKDRMTDIKNSCSSLAKLSKEREDALQAAVPSIQLQQENDVLENAADWAKFYDDDTAWLRDKAKSEAEQVLQTNRELTKIEQEWAALRVKLEELKIVKQEPEVAKAEWTAIFEIRELMLQHPKMVIAFFGTGYLGKLEKKLEAILEDLGGRIEALKDSVFDAINISRDEVKEFLVTDFNVRLGDAIQDVRTAHLGTIEENQELKGLYDDVTARLERRDEKLAESQEANKKALEDVENLNRLLSNLQTSHDTLTEDLDSINKHNAQALEDVRNLEQRRSELQTSQDVLRKNLDSSNKNNAHLLASLKTNEESHQVALSVEKEAHKGAVREKDKLQIKLDELHREFKDLSVRSSQEALIHQTDEDTIKGLETDLAQEKSKLKDAKDKTVDQSNTIADLKTELAQEKSKLKDAKDKTVESSNEIASLKTDLAQEKSKLKDAEDKTVESSNEIESLKTDLAQEKSKLKDAKDKTVESSNEIASLKDKLAQKKTELAQKKRKLSDAEYKTVERSNEISSLKANLDEEREKLGDAKEQAIRDSDDISSLKANLDEEREKLRKATLQHQEKASQYSLLARLEVLRTPAIQARPVEELEAIVGRAVGFTQSTSNIEAARLLDSTNTDLSEGTQLIADAPNVFILIDSNTVTIFDKVDIQCVEYDSMLKMRMVMFDYSLPLCSTSFDVEKSGICERWMGRCGVVLTKVGEIA